MNNKKIYWLVFIFLFALLSYNTSTDKEKQEDQLNKIGNNSLMKHFPCLVTATGY